MNICANCRHSKMATQLNSTALFCFRFPPHIQALPTGPGQITFASLRPAVERTDSCGEFESTPMVVS